MTPAALRLKLTDLIATWENEVVEIQGGVQFLFHRGYREILFGPVE